MHLPPVLCPPHPVPVQRVPAILTCCSLQIISQSQVKAENITSDVGLQIKQLLLVELAALLRRYVCVCVCVQHTVPLCLGCQL